MLENIINKTKIFSFATIICGNFYGCSTTETSYPLKEKLSNIQYCAGDDNRHLYCDDEFVYPAMVIKFK